MDEAKKAHTGCKEAKKNVASKVDDDRTTIRQLQRINNKLKLELQKVNGNYSKLSNEHEALLKQKADLMQEVEDLSDAIFNEHTFGFNKVIAQVVLFLLCIPLIPLALRKNAQS